MSLFFRSMSLVAILTLVGGTLDAAEQPNILFIVVDDQSPFDLRMYNPASVLDTPNLDSIAKNGVVLDGAYHMGSFSGAVCTPSRHMIMSGRSVWHLPIAPWGAKTSPPNLEQFTMPAVFNGAGFATMRTCKLGNSYEAANKLFTVRRDASKRGGTPETGSAWHAEQVLDYLDERAEQKDKRPFLIHFGFSHPHDTRDGTPELLAKYSAKNHTDEKKPPVLDDKMPPLPINYLSAHPFDTTHSDVRDDVAVSGVWKRRDEASIRNEIGRQNACSEYIDQQVGRVIRRLKETGEYDNTYIFYTADHGIAIGRHGLMGKQSLYEHCWRVPFIASGPSIPAGTRHQGNTYLMDLLATLCDFTGVAVPPSNLGTSFRSVLEGKQETIRDVVYGVYCGGSKPGMRSVRSGDWKLIEYEAPDRKVRETQLFNLAENPNELIAEHASAANIAAVKHRPDPLQSDLAEDPDYAKKLDEMRGLLLSEMRRWEDPFRFSFQPDDSLPPIPAAPNKKPNSKKLKAATGKK